MADYAEGLCAKALHLTLVDKPATGYDGTDSDGHKIEVKARRLTKENGSLLNQKRAAKKCMMVHDLCNPLTDRTIGE